MTMKSDTGVSGNCQKVLTCPKCGSDWLLVDDKGAYICMECNCEWINREGRQ